VAHTTEAWENSNDPVKLRSVSAHWRHPWPSPPAVAKGCANIIDRVPDCPALQNPGTLATQHLNLFYNAS